MGLQDQKQQEKGCHWFFFFLFLLFWVFQGSAFPGFGYSDFWGLCEGERESLMRLKMEYGEPDAAMEME